MITVEWSFNPWLDAQVCHACLELLSGGRAFDIVIDRLDLENDACGTALKDDTERRAKKRVMYRNHKILELPRLGEIACQYCHRQDGTVVMAHSNQLTHGKGKGIKAHDCFVAALCHSCHAFVDQGQGMRLARETVWQSAHERTVPLFQHLLDDVGRQLLREATA